MPTFPVVNKDAGSTGYGMMNLTWRAQATPEPQAFAAMKAALNTGATFWNAADFYGPPEYNSLHLLKSYFTKYPEDADKVVLSIKGCVNMAKGGPDNSEEGVRESVETSLKVLDGRKKIDIFTPGRIDPKVAIEDTMGYLAKYVKEGKIGGIALSECGAQTIRKAVKVHKISAVEVEFSLFSTDILTNGVAEACAENDIPIVAYSPLSRGLLTGQVKSHADIPEGDVRGHLPRFQPENFEANLKLVEEVNQLAQKKGCTSGQIAISWVKHYSGKKGMPVIIPIPGATTESRVLENSKDVDLSEEDMKTLGEFLKRCEVKGDRYMGPLAKMMWG